MDGDKPYASKFLFFLKNYNAVWWKRCYVRHALLLHDNADVSKKKKLKFYLVSSYKLHLVFYFLIVFRRIRFGTHHFFSLGGMQIVSVGT